MGKVISQWLDWAFEIWNTIIKETFDVLIKLPNKKDLGYQTISILNDVNMLFVGVGTSLVVLFFVIGFCQETVDVKEEMRYDNIVKYLIRLCMAEYFTINSKTVLLSILECCSNLTRLLKSHYNMDKSKLKVTEADKEILKDCKFWEGILIMAIAIIVGLLIIVMAAMIWYTAWSRMLKLLILIPFGSLAFSTMAGAGEVGRISSTYLKKFIAVGLECVVIAVALFFGIALMNCNEYVSLKFMGKGWTSVIGHLLAMLLQAGILTGTVKGAEYIMKDMIGVY